MDEAQRYDAFMKRLEELYPRAMRNVYCGVSINEGWFHIIEALVKNIHQHIKWKRKMRARELVNQRKRVDDVKVTEYVPHIEIHQIKEKFGGLRFYYEGGDEQVHGMVRMAEAWADSTCELCGTRGSLRTGGWVKNLCDAHEKERQERYKDA